MELGSCSASLASARLRALEGEIDEEVNVEVMAILKTKMHHLQALRLWREDASLGLPQMPDVGPGCMIEVQTSKLGTFDGAVVTS